MIELTDLSVVLMAILRLWSGLEYNDRGILMYDYTFWLPKVCGTTSKVLIRAKSQGFNIQLPRSELRNHLCLDTHLLAGCQGSLEPDHGHERGNSDIRVPLQRCAPIRPGVRTGENRVHEKSHKHRGFSR